jgi:regulator of cell morphogenesis and NO signaling
VGASHAKTVVDSNVKDKGLHAIDATSTGVAISRTEGFRKMSNSVASTLNLLTPIGEWVAHYPQTADVFRRLRIDYCCDGHKPFEKACWEKGLDVIRVHSLVQRSIAQIDDPEMDDWLHRPLSELCDHIEQTHHLFLARALPLLSTLMASVVELEETEAFRRFQEHFIDWRDDMLNAIVDEERSLFPAIRALEQKHPEGRRPNSIAAMIRPIQFLHQDIAEAVKMLGVLSGDSQIPEHATTKCVQMHKLLKSVESDVRHHVHKEEFILFPRALQLEASLARQSAGGESER